MIVHGGLDEKSRLLDTFYSLNMNTFKWLECQLVGEGPGKVSHHKCCVVLNPERKKHKFDLFEQTSKSEAYFKNSVIKEEGIYFYGGINSDGYSIGTLSILKIQRKNFQWIQPEVSGTPPPARYGHSMHYIDWMNSIVVFGGRYDSDFLSADKIPKVLNDLWMLTLKDLEWRQVKSNGEVPKPVYAHNSEVYGSQLLIFGGL